RDAGFAQTLVSELRLSSASDGPIRWIAGLFYFEREFVRNQRAIGFFGRVGGEQDIEESGWAPFLNVTWSPIDDFELFGGVRWNRDTFERSEFAGAIPGIRPEATLDGRKERFRETTREVGFRWFFAEGHMLYAKFAKGYKAGFVEIDQNGAFGPAGSANVISPEILDAWEVGVKTSWLDETLQVNVSGYFYGYDDLQVPIPLGLQALTLNAADATIKGAELEVNYQPLPNWNTRLAVSYIDATFGAFCSPDPFQFTPGDDPGCERDPTNPAIPPPNGVDGSLDLSGNRLEDTPEWQVSLVSRFTYPLGEWGALTSVLSFRWVDDYFARPFNVGLVDGIDSYTQTDIRFIWRSPEGRYTVEIFGSHLEDESIYGRRIVAPEFVANPSLIGLYAPRRFGIRIGFEWGGQ
ncbi:MAG: TonB-dependent receptor domain-containing protein, partial [Myxococcota bacterium]